MTRYRCPALLVLPAFAALPAGAAAGSPGATSRGTIAISITIPPRVQVTPAPAVRAGASAGPSGWCVAGTGLGAYRVEMVQNGAEQRARIAGAKAMPAAAACATNVRVAPAAAGGPSALVTVLIVPD